MEKHVKVGVSVLIINKRNQILLGVRKGSHGAGMLSVPGGHLEYLESANDCCTRELLEEIGVAFDNQYKPIGFSEDVYGEKHYITLYYVVEDVDSDNILVQTLEPEKCEGWNWLDFETLPSNLFCDTYNKLKEYYVTRKIS